MQLLFNAIADIQIRYEDRSLALACYLFNTATIHKESVSLSSLIPKEGSGLPVRRIRD